MRHQVDHRKLGRTASHRRALFRNMATSLILAERIETTLPKAKELRRVADNLITLAKDGTLHKRRQAASFLKDPDAVGKLFSVLADRFRDRQGGYTRIFRFGSRLGDGASMAAIEYLGYQLPVKEKHEEGAKKKPKLKPPVKAAEKKAKKKNEPEEGTGKWKIFGRKKKDTKAGE